MSILQFLPTSFRVSWCFYFAFLRWVAGRARHASASHRFQCMFLFTLNFSRLKTCLTLNARISLYNLQLVRTDITRLRRVGQSAVWEIQQQRPGIISFSCNFFIQHFQSFRRSMCEHECRAEAASRRNWKWTKLYQKATSEMYQQEEVCGATLKQMSILCLKPFPRVSGIACICELFWSLLLALRSFFRHFLNRWSS